MSQLLLNETRAYNMMTTRLLGLIYTLGTMQYITHFFLEGLSKSRAQVEFFLHDNGWLQLYLS